MRLISKLLILVAVALSMAACDKSPVQEKETAMFVGMWQVSSDNPKESVSLWIFFDDGTAKQISGFSGKKAYSYWKPASGKWSYDKDTKILATDVNYYQWIITMNDDQTWTAMSTDSKYHYSASRFTPDDEELLYIILIGSKWEGGKLGTMSFFSAESLGAGRWATVNYPYIKCSMPSGIAETEEVKWSYLGIYHYDDVFNFVLFHKTLNPYLEDTATSVKTFKITDPLSPAKCRLVFEFSTGHKNVHGLFESDRSYSDIFHPVR